MAYVEVPTSSGLFDNGLEQDKRVPLSERYKIPHRPSDAAQLVNSPVSTELTHNIDLDQIPIFTHIEKLHIPCGCGSEYVNCLADLRRVCPVCGGLR